jgi:hypothetical protein
MAQLEAFEATHEIYLQFHVRFACTCCVAVTLRTALEGFLVLAAIFGLILFAAWRGGFVEGSRRRHNRARVLRRPTTRRHQNIQGSQQRELDAGAPITIRRRCRPRDTGRNAARRFY